MKNILKLGKKTYIAAGCVLIVGGYYWYSKSATQETAVEYKTVSVERGEIVATISGSGNIIVDQSSTVDPTINGTVADLAVNVGDKVSKGQFLFDIINDQLGIDAASAYAAMLQSKQNLESARAAKKQAAYDLEHNHSGLAKKQILEDKLDSAEAALDAADENTKVAEAKYKNALSDARKRRVVSPIDGTVNAINIKNGDDLSRLSNSSSSEAPMIIGDLKTLKAKVEINEVDISEVAIGQEATLTFNAIEGLSVIGKVEKIDSLGTLTSGVVTYDVTIGFEELDPRLRPEMSVSAAIMTGKKNDVLKIPSGAIKVQDGKSYVQIMDGHALRRVVVESGIQNDTHIEILSGLREGEKIVTQTVSRSSASSAASSAGGGGLHIPGLGGGRS